MLHLHCKPLLFVTRKVRSWIFTGKIKSSISMDVLICSMVSCLDRLETWVMIMVHACTFRTWNLLKSQSYPLAKFCSTGSLYEDGLALYVGGWKGWGHGNLGKLQVATYRWSFRLAGCGSGLCFHMVCWLGAPKPSYMQGRAVRSKTLSGFCVWGKLPELVQILKEECNKISPSISASNPKVRKDTP